MLQMNVITLFSDYASASADLFKWDGVHAFSLFLLLHTCILCKQNQLRSKNTELLLGRVGANGAEIHLRDHNWVCFSHRP